MSTCLNRSKSQDIATRIQNEEGMLKQDVGVWQMNYPDLKATHTFGDDKKVVPKTSTLVGLAGEERLLVHIPRAFPHDFAPTR